MAGQTLGTRSFYAYTSDSGTVYSLLLDDTLAAIGGLTADDSNPSPPRRFRPRCVFVEGVVSGGIARKRIVCSQTAALYDSETSGSVTIDGVSFSSTGRRGESLSFPRNVTVQA